MRLRIACLLLTLLVLCTAIAHAYPTLTGPTGMATLPTAGVLSANHLDVAADYYNTRDPNIGTECTIAIRAEYGALSFLEFGGNYLAVSGSDAWGVNAKIRTPVRLGGLDWAVGTQYLTNSAVDSQVVQAYLVGSRPITVLPLGNSVLMGTIGANWTELHNPTAGFDASALRAFGGLEFTLLNGLTIGAEYQTKNPNILDQQALSSYYLRVPLGNQLRVQAGFTNAGAFRGENGPLSAVDNHRFFAGAAVRFGR